MSQHTRSRPTAKLLKPLLLCLPLIMASACSIPEQTDAHAPANEGRAETQNIRNTESIGYSGNAMANKIDSALDANDERIKSMEESSQY